MRVKEKLCSQPINFCLSGMKGNKYKDIVGLTLEQRLKGEKRPISSDTTEVPKKRKKTKKVTSVKENVAVAEPIETDSPAKAKKKLRRKKKLAKEAIDLVTKLVDETKESDSSDSEVSDIRETESTPKPQLKKKDVKKKEEKEKPKSTSEKLQERLKGSHFRYLNEQLYKCTTEEAENLFKVIDYLRYLFVNIRNLVQFQNDPDAFQAYHQGFTDQSARWPVNPLDLIIADLNKK